MAKKIRLRCPCGEVLVADDEDEIVAKANAHLEAEHPTMAGEYSREQILFMTY
jgi:predicted small metal-binding protein